MAFGLKNIFSSLQKSVATKPRAVVGIDVGSSSIKVVEIEQTDKALTLRTYGELQLGPYAGKSLGESVTLEHEKLVEALVDVIRESGVKTHDGVLAIPLSASFVTTIPITVKEGEKLETKIRVEGRKYIPVPLSDIMLDWTVLNEYGDKDARVHEVLLAAIQNDAYQRYQRLMQATQMVSQPSEIEVFSAIRGISRPDDTTVAIVEMGAETNKLFIVNNGALERTHRVYDGGATCTKRIAQALDVSFEEAENLKRSYTEEMPQARDIYKVYTNSLERSAQEFKRVIDQYEARMGAPIGRVVLSGGGAGFPNAEKYLSNALNKEVQLVRPFDKVAYPAFMEDALGGIGLSFAQSLGAALRPFEALD